MNDLINHDDEMICPVCNAIGRIPKRKIRVSDLTLPEFKALMVECSEMIEQNKYDTAMKEYDRLTTKPIVTDEVFVKDGKPVVPFVKEYLKACKKYPTADISVSR